MSNIAGALYRVTKIASAKTKWSAAGEWGQCHASVSSNRHVLKRLRKERSDGASLTAGGRLFQARAAATGNRNMYMYSVGYTQTCQLWTVKRVIPPPPVHVPLPVSYLMMSLSPEGKNLSANQISSTYLGCDITIPFWKNKRPPYCNSSSLCDFDHIAVICMLFWIMFPNYAQIWPSAAE